MSDRLRSIIADLLLAIFAFLAAVILLIGASICHRHVLNRLDRRRYRILAVIIIFFSLIIALRAYLKNKISTSVSSFAGKLMLNRAEAHWF